MSHHAHPDTPDGWADSVADWAEENAAELRHFTGTAHRAKPLPAERQWVAPQGRPAWPARRCSVEPTVIDRLPEEFDAEDQSEGADGVFWVYMATIGAVIAAAALAAFT